MSYRLGAYEADVTIEIFEECGYIRYKDLDQFFDDCYFDFETKLTREKFIKISKDNLMKHPKYKEFMNNEVKMCSKCKKLKPLSSFASNKISNDGKGSYCGCCDNEYRKEYRKTEKGKEVTRKKNENYRANHKDKCIENQRRYREKNREKLRMEQAVIRMRKYLENIGILIKDKEKLEVLANLKIESGINKYESFVRAFEDTINGYQLSRWDN